LNSLKIAALIRAGVDHAESLAPGGRREAAIQSDKLERRPANKDLRVFFQELE
jgi:hypothetical protein